MEKREIIWLFWEYIDFLNNDWKQETKDELTFHQYAKLRSYNIDIKV